MTIELSTYHVGLEDGNCFLRCAAVDDKEALRELARRHGPKVVDLMSRILGDDEAAYSAGADTFVRLWRRRMEFDFDDPFDDFLYRCAVTAARSYELKKGRHCKAMSASAFGATFASLGFAERTIVALHYSTELSVERIARIVGLPRLWVDLRLSHARRILRRSI